MDNFYTEIVDLLDEFVETYQGRFDRLQFSKADSDLENYKEGASQQYLQKFITASEEMKKELGEEPSDLQNILDEIIGLTQKTIYLLSLS